MKVIALVLALGGLAFSIPRPKLFYEHFEDFIELIAKESGHDLELLLQQYVKYPEFVESIDFMQTNEFMDVVCEVESLSEFKALVRYLEEENIDIVYFVDMLNQLLGTFNIKRTAPQQSSGKNVTAYMRDSIRLFPKTKLVAMFDHKMEKYKEFKATIEKLRSQEWRRILHDLLTNKSFQTHYNILAKNGIDVTVLIKEIMAVFGQN